MKTLIEKIREQSGTPSVTLTLPTHRSKPDSLNDPILLKNLASEAEEEMLLRFGKDEAGPVIQRLERVMEEIDHNYNLEGLVVYANKDFGEFARIPVTISQKVFVNNRFMERPLWKAAQMDHSYYVLVFSRRNARLIKADGDAVVEEIRNEYFPMENKVIETDPLVLTMSQGQERIYEQFFREVYKAVWETAKNNRLPLLLAAEKSNQDVFNNIADDKFTIAGGILRTRDDEEAGSIVADAWPVMISYGEKLNENRKKEIEKAINANQLITDVNSIWRALHEGRGDILFVEDEFYLPAIKSDDGLALGTEKEEDKEGITEDIIDEMISVNAQKGGNIVFLDSDAMKAYNGLALATRY